MATFTLFSVDVSEAWSGRVPPVARPCCSWARERSRSGFVVAHARPAVSCLLISLLTAGNEGFVARLRCFQNTPPPPPSSVAIGPCNAPTAPTSRRASPGQVVLAVDFNSNNSGLFRKIDGVTRPLVCYGRRGGSCFSSPVPSLSPSCLISLRFSPPVVLSLPSLHMRHQAKRILLLYIWIEQRPSTG